MNDHYLLKGLGKVRENILWMTVEMLWKKENVRRSSPHILSARSDSGRYDATTEMLMGNSTSAWRRTLTEWSPTSLMWSSMIRSLRCS